MEFRCNVFQDIGLDILEKIEGQNNAYSRVFEPKVKWRISTCSYFIAPTFYFQINFPFWALAASIIFVKQVERFGWSFAQNFTKKHLLSRNFDAKRAKLLYICHFYYLY